MRIHFNSTAMNAYRNYSLHNSNIAKAMQRLSSGLRINSAADDPAGFAVSEKLKQQLTMLDRDKANAMDYQSMLNVADGSLNEIHSMLNRMEELADQAANGTYSDLERKNMNSEYQQLLDEINRIGASSAFNGKSIFGGSAADAAASGADSSSTLVIKGNHMESYLNGLDRLLTDISQAAKDDDDEKLLSLGIDRSNGKSDKENLKDAVLNFTKNQGSQLMISDSDDGSWDGLQYKLVLSDGDIVVNMPEVSSKSMGLSGTNLLDADSAGLASDAIKKAIGSISSWRGNIGAMTNRLDHTINNISSMSENLTNALSRITDADMAKEMMNLVKEQVLAQASMFAMAQANQQPDQIVTLLKSL